jgi:hypothetical protein
MPRLISLVLILAFVLAACGTPPDDSSNDTFGNDPAITWDRNPDTVVFRAEITGGNREAEFGARNDIAPCTVYGDNRVVWTNELGAFEEQVLFDQVTDEALRYFIETLTVVDRFYTYPARADLQLPSSDVVPVYEQLTLTVAGQQAVSDSFAGWPADYYRTLLERCRTISQAPVLFEPSAGWFSAQAASFDMSAPIYPWDSVATGITLADLAVSGQRRWVSDNMARIVWNLIRTSPPTLLLNENGLAYTIAFEVPRVTRYSPPVSG